MKRYELGQDIGDYVYLGADFILHLIFDVDVNCEHITDKPVAGD